MDFNKTIRINRLYDFYHLLLTDYQQEIFELYYQEDWSLKEIADYKKVSRNAIFTLLKRVVVLLEKYEEKLHILTQYEQINEALEQVSDIDALKTNIKKILE